MTEQKTLGEESKDYEPKTTLTVADLEAVSLSQEVKHKVKKDRDGEEYSAAYINVDGEEYRIPSSVLEAIQAIQKEKPDLKTVKVTKTGEGLKTKYQVIEIE